MVYSIPCRATVVLWVVTVTILGNCSPVEGFFAPSSLRTATTTRRHHSTRRQRIRMTQHSLVDNNRRQYIIGTPIIASSSLNQPPANGLDPTSSPRLVKVTDPNTYSALVYTPPPSTKPPPLIVVLHGAGKNEGNVWDLADIRGEHAGLIPSLIASNQAPPVLLDNFAVVAPYCQGKRSFYEEPRQKLLQFIDWVCSDVGKEAGCPAVDTSRIWLLGFSDGATEVVELLTTGRFRGGIVAAYGFTGILPDRALDRLKDVPIWVFHSADDVIFPVDCSDRLVTALRKSNSDKDIVRYSRFDRDQEGFVRGHSTGITASKSSQVYEWMLSFE